jgi:hypothetical protein
MVGNLIQQRMGALYAPQNFVCGGHGARRPKHGTFTLPKGITVKFYIPDTKPLPNDVGQQVDRILTGGAPPPAESTAAPGSTIWNYHLYSPRNGGYLALGMSGKASDRYISTTDSTNGIALSVICNRIAATCPNAIVHWSACRSIEGDGDVFPDTGKPDYDDNPALAKLASKAGKI